MSVYVKSYVKKMCMQRFSVTYSVTVMFLPSYVHFYESATHDTLCDRQLNTHLSTRSRRVRREGKPASDECCKE